MRKKWILATKRDNFVRSSYAVLCSGHFKNSDFQFRVKGGLTVLKTEAIPSVFDFPAHLLKKVTPRVCRKRKLVENRYLSMLMFCIYTVQVLGTAWRFVILCFRYVMIVMKSSL